MMEGNEIIKALRACAQRDCGACTCYQAGLNCDTKNSAAADLIEKQERQIQTLKWERDAAVKQLRKIADCGTCRKDRPEGVDGPECVACTRGQNWEWNGGAEMR